MAEWPELPKRVRARGPRPEPKLNTAEDMFKAIKRIMKRQLTEANKSQYDVLVCIRSVDAARAVFERIPVEGTACDYGNTVLAALFDLQEKFWDSEGQYTSKGRVGDVCSDVWALLDRQWSLEHPNIDRKEARSVIITEMAELSRSISGPPGDTGETTIKIKAQGQSGTPYYLEITFDVTSPKEFDMLGKIYSDASCNILIQEERLPLTAADGN